MVRDLTENEIQAFSDKGWVLAKNYVGADFVAELLKTAKQMLQIEESSGLAAAESQVEKSRSAQAKWWHSIDRPCEKSSTFRTLAWNSKTAENISRLHRREVGVQFFRDTLACKAPETTHADGPTPWHQDAPYFPLDRSGTIAVWIALDYVEPVQGSMRFMEGSHRNGRLGHPVAWTTKDKIHETYPRIREECSESAPLSYAPGDATFHHSHTVHGAPQNMGEQPRWSWIAAYFASDSLYTGQDCPETNDKGLELYAPLNHPAFPLLW
jgi:ectoine hydroxylase-related dioxygenase (phytanoyl-CoA dioxygenase family)